MTPTALVQYARTKDAEAFARVVREYQALVFATCRRQLRNTADVEDAVQETFLRLAQKASQLHTNLAGWLHTCAVNVSIDIKRRRQSRVRHESAAAPDLTASDGTDRDLAELREHLDAALNKLSDADRDLIVQRFFVGVSQAELATKIGVAPSTVSLRLNRAIDALREDLKTCGCMGAAASAAALERALTAEHASAVVPQSLTANLMKIGLSGVAGGPAISIRSLLIAGVAFVLVAIGGWIVWEQVTTRDFAAPSQLAQSPATAPAPPGITVGASSQPDATVPPDWSAAHANTQSAVLAGRVVDCAHGGARQTERY